jgi:hypothetical protein
MRKLVRSVVVIAIAAISSPAFASQAGGAPHPPSHALSQGEARLIQPESQDVRISISRGIFAPWAYVRENDCRRAQ